MLHSQSRERAAKIRDFVANGGSRAMAVEKFDVRRCSVDGYCRGLPRTKAARHVGQLVILAALLEGKTQSEAAESLGISRQRVHQIAKAAREAGIKIPSKPS